MKFIFIILFSLAMAGEMTVDGNLNVTDTLSVTNIKSSQIDSLLSLIAQLEMRIAQLECQNTGIIPDGYCDCFFNTLDECGVCDGGNLSCSDCLGVPNGNNLLDNCGICDNDTSNDCVQDCLGEWGGLAEYDSCGDCAGDVINQQNCPRYALRFDGIDDQVNININPDFYLGENEFTINIRMKLDDVDDNGIVWGGGGDCTYAIYYNHSGTGQLVYWLSSSNSCHDIISGTHDGGSAIGTKSDWNPNQWYYLTAIKDGSIYSFYVDGILDYSLDAISSDLSIDFSLAGINKEYLKGELSTFTIWNYAFNIDEILELDDIFYIGNETGLIGLWNFSEGSGSVLYDSSGNGNNGTISGATWVQR